MSKSGRKANNKPQPEPEASNPGLVSGTLWVVIGLSMCALLGYLAWQRVGPLLVASESFRFEPENLVITPAPGWIRSDIKAEVIAGGAFDQRKSILAEDLVAQVAQAFAFHPWVAKVEQVEKIYPGKIQVQLIYRRPVAVVKLEATQALELLPIDQQGFRLPARDFSSVELRRLPRISGITNLPLEGRAANDPRVKTAARLAALLENDWHRFELALIVPPDRTDSSEAAYRLVTRAGTTVLWGPMTEQTSVDSLSNQDKLARLQAYFQHQGTLDGNHAGQMLDVRRLPATKSRRG